jgi:DNA repair exonuclease SbcCD ATPase subunit
VWTIGKKIRLAFQGKKPETVETIRFIEIKSYIKKLRDHEKHSKDYSLLIKRYEDLIEKLVKVKKEVKILKKNGEKKFTGIITEYLNNIIKLNEFNIYLFRNFYNETSQTIKRIMKIPGVTQYRTLKYKNGKKTIAALNSFLKSYNNLRSTFLEITENDTMIHYENAIKKYEEIETKLNKRKDLQHRIELLINEKKEKKKNLEESIVILKEKQLKIDNQEIIETEKRIKSLKDNIIEMSSDLKINLRKGRRPISKILHKSNKKIFNFFKYFTQYPLENINESFWEMIEVLEKEKINLIGKQKKEIEDFLNFSNKKLKDTIREYINAKMKKKEIEERYNYLSSKKQNFLRESKQERVNAEKDYKLTSRKLDEKEKEKGILDIEIKKNIKMLEKILSELNNKVKIDFKKFP